MENKNNFFAITTVVLSILICIIVIVGLAQPNINDNYASNTINIQQKSEKQKVNINTATKSELMTLPNIGENKAIAIIANRPYLDEWDIAEVDSIGTETLKNIIDLIEV